MLSPKRKSPAKYKLATRHKLPRALKKAIKKKLVKIVKEAKKEIAEEQHLKTTIDMDSRIFEHTNFIRNLDTIIDINRDDISEQLLQQLSHLRFRYERNATAAIERQTASLESRAVYAQAVLDGNYLTKELKVFMLGWKRESESSK